MVINIIIFLLFLFAFVASTVRMPARYYARPSAKSAATISVLKYQTRVTISQASKQLQKHQG